MAPSTLRDHLRAAAVLLVGGAMLMAGFPGLDFLGAKRLKAKAPALGVAGAGLVWFDQTVRLPVAREVKPVERLFRVSQEFHLYRDGPSRVDRLEILVDGELVYRTRDDAYAWRADQLGNRHFRPMVATAAQKADAANQRGICRWVVAQARADFPQAQEVRLQSTRTRFGVDAPHVRFSRVARAPGWTCSGARKEKKP